MSSFISKTVQVVFTILLFFILFAFAISVGGMVADGFIGNVVTITLLALCVLFICLGNTILEVIRRRVVGPVSSLSTKQMVFLLGIVILVTKAICIFVLNVDSTLHPDMKMYHSFANQIANKGEITEYVSYATKHNYTAIYGMILSPFAKLFGEDPKVLTMVLSVAVTVVSILLFDIIRKHTGNVIAFCGVLLYNLFPMGLFQTQLLVHETALLFFHILSLWLILKAFENKGYIVLKIVLMALSALCIAIGLSINAAGQVVLISLYIISMVNIIGEKITMKKIIKLICFFLVFTIIVSFVMGVLKNTVNSLINAEESSILRAEKRVPYAWSFYLGLNYKESGVINKEDADIYHKYEGIEDIEEAKQYQIDLIRDRMKEYINNPIKIPIHLFNKIKVLWGGIWLPFPYAQGNSVEQFILLGAGGFIYKGLYFLNAMVYLLILSMILFSVKTKRKKLCCENCLNLHFKMVIIGVTLVLICFEVCLKYASHLHILMYAIWMLQVKDFTDNSALIKKKLQKTCN